MLRLQSGAVGARCACENHVMHLLHLFAPVRQVHAECNYMAGWFRQFASGADCFAPDPSPCMVSGVHLPCASCCVFVCSAWTCMASSELSVSCIAPTRGQPRQRGCCKGCKQPHHAACTYVVQEDGTCTGRTGAPPSHLLTLRRVPMICHDMSGRGSTGPNERVPTGRGRAREWTFTYGDGLWSQVTGHDWG